MRDIRLAVIEEEGDQCRWCHKLLPVGLIVAVENDADLFDSFDCWAKTLRLINVTH